MNEEPPVTDAADYVSAFMGLPEVMQSAALMVVYAARDLPKDQAKFVEEFVKAMSKGDQLGSEGAHFMAMCSHVLTAQTIARHVNPDY